MKKNGVELVKDKLTNFQQCHQTHKMKYCSQQFAISLKRFKTPLKRKVACHSLNKKWPA